MDNHSADMVEFGPHTHVLVTGGAGFVGSALVDLLLARNCSVTVIDDLSNGSLGNLPASDPRLAIRTFRVGDPAFNTAVHDEVGRADAVFHLASPIGVQRAHKERFAVTSGILESGCAIIEACRLHRRPLLYTSSSEVYGSGRDRPITEADPVMTDIRPRWGYAAAKSAVEHLVAGLFFDFGIPTWIVRPFNMAGPRQRAATGLVLPVFVKAALRGEPLIVHDDGEQRRAFLHVSDAAEGLLLAMQCRSLRGRPVNLGGSEAVQIGNLAKMVVEATKTNAPIVMKPSNAVYGERFAVTYDRVPDTNLLTTMTGWRPLRSTKQTIVDCIEHMRAERVMA
ncbi:NAD-dependent epimerase/dehydratase family protein [Mesorhizobium sp. M1E.F.Ca.ET.045.02.1.1]|uniref:NAD-dependent epimerase/dehydratase family protein n=1 Tax=Mesorhizobium sp. M1E.F.Ca.ET.045.02.1.1 TaxID=2493672 RepID=UPI000F759492|nr:NAD-dependent epimerase/dehydratase family protein [Mesorhizobium sp. M1E.F.Ca.ET.045.02.1.1]AZO25006.1 NAD-dependent epimerase/dehydratase family protein [Mesorhizobium sp. M1E.F.Ca.ET.045.02.1.1]TKB17562.1 MAG: NAD-dependent epimerase/dehydratase family protein [Mesorhizobium sp.]